MRLKKDCTLNVGFILYCAALGIAIFLSSKLGFTDYYSAYWRDVSIWDVPLFLVLVTVLCCAITRMDMALGHANAEPVREKPDKCIRVAVAVALLVSWVPVFIAFYPGNLSPDSYSSIKQALGSITSTAHPVLYTLLVRLCLRIGLLLFGTMNAAVATYSVLQMVVVALTLSYSVTWLWRRGCSRRLLCLTILYLALNPLICRYSFTMWKDIPFSLVMVLLTLFLLDVALGDRSFYCPCDVAYFVILTMLAAFLRNRVGYAIIAVYTGVVVFAIRSGKESVKWLASLFATVSVVILVVQGPVYDAFGIQPSNYVEGQGVTLQQVSAIVVEGGDMSDAEMEFIERVIPLESIKESYQSGSVDYVKNRPEFDHAFLNSHKLEYLQVWLSLVLRNPDIALRSWLLETCGFWGFGVYFQPFAITWPNEELGIHQVNLTKQITGVDIAYLSNGLLSHINWIPVMRRLFECGTLGWIALLCVVLQKSKRVRWALAPLLAQWIILLFTTPTLFEPRYLFTYYLFLPVFAWLILTSRQKRAVIRQTASYEMRGRNIAAQCGICAERQEGE